ncbi:MAG: DNA adenine methylase [Lentisphaeraceae bacterium]|nr:DNA adenine methylase [Lentisphaeraceae bacterium]
MRNQLKAPFPYFGGKSTVAEEVWKRFGVVNNYIEPFCGSLAVLLARPRVQGYETVNDKSHFISNFWRAVKNDPERVEHFSDFPVSEADLHSRHSWLMHSEDMKLFRKAIEENPNFYNSKIAGWWSWGACQWIGGGWCSESGMTKEGKVHQKRPNIGSKKGLMKAQIPNLHGTRGIHRGADNLSWLEALSKRLRQVRVCNGDWKRVCSSKSVTTLLGMTAVFLDPPYGDSTNRDMRLYAEESGTVASEVGQWCLENGSNKLMRIALCGYEGEHDELEKHGWIVFEWKANGGYSNRSGGDNNSKRERIWFSPHCSQHIQAEINFN